MKASGNFIPPPGVVTEAIAFREAVMNSPTFDGDEWGASDLGDFDFNVWTEDSRVEVTIYPVIRHGNTGHTDTSRWLTIGDA